MPNHTNDAVLCSIRHETKCTVYIRFEHVFALQKLSDMLQSFEAYRSSGPVVARDLLVLLDVQQRLAAEVCEESKQHQAKLVSSHHFERWGKPNPGQGGRKKTWAKRLSIAKQNDYDTCDMSQCQNNAFSNSPWPRWLRRATSPKRNCTGQRGVSLDNFDFNNITSEVVATKGVDLTTPTFTTTNS